MSKELTVIPNFALARPFEGMDAELLAELRDEMADLDTDGGINCRQIKIPAGGKLAFEIQGEEDGDEEYVKEIDCVIVFTHSLNGYWANAFGSSNNPEDKIPVCSSIDGKSGVNTQTGTLSDCALCPYNQYGTDAKGGKGKACKNMRRMYLMRPNDPNFYLLTVPPTSIKEVNKALTRIMASKGLPYTNLVVTLKLQKATNANGIDYSTVTIEKKGLLPPESAGIAREMRGQIKAKYTEMTISLDDYDAPQLAAAPGCVKLEEANDEEELPF